MNRILGFIIFISMALFIVGGIHYYFWLRLIRDTALPAFWRNLGVAFLTLMAVSIPTSFFLLRTLPVHTSQVVLAPIYVWMGFMLLLFSLLLCGELVKIGLRFVPRLAYGMVNDCSLQQIILSPMRSIAVVAVLGASLMTGYGIHTAFREVSVRQVTMKLPKLPAYAHGTTVVQLTDLHLGATLGRKWLEKVVQQVNTLNPDVIVITGDLIDGSVSQMREAVTPLASLKSKYGVFFVTGNHEYYSGVEAWLAELPRLGIKVLANEHVRIGEGNGKEMYDLAGVFDLSAASLAPHQRPDIAHALSGHDSSFPLILLAHQPRAVSEAAPLGVTLQLSGHTHGGQLWPWIYLVKLQQRYLAGLYTHQGTLLYVSSGTGFWGPPMRLGTSCEITHFTLLSPSVQDSH